MSKIREFTQIIGVIERGDAADDLTKEVNKVLEALRDAAGPKSTAKGSVTLKLNFAVQGQTIEIDAEIGSSIPKAKRARSLYFLTKDGEISTEHPNQKDLFEGPRAVNAAE